MNLDDPPKLFSSLRLIRRTANLTEESIFSTKNDMLDSWLCPQGAIAAHLLCDPFRSSRQQLLELLSLIVTLVGFHIGVLLHAGQHRSNAVVVQILLSLFQFVLNSIVVWHFFSCIFKDMTLVSRVESPTFRLQLSVF